MVRMIDAQQRHIRFEKRGTCKGSFFDVGEFLDLSRLTILDFFKGLVAPECR